MKRIALVLSLVACPQACTQSPPTPQPAVNAPTSKSTPQSSAVAQTESSAPAETPNPPEPAYDLAADLDGRKKKLREELGTKATFEVVEGVFLLVAPSGSMGYSAAVAKKALEAYFNGRFSRKPERAVAVLLFETAPPYDAYCKTHWKKPCSTPYGFYDHHIRTVVMNAGPGLGTLTHELVHPIVETDFPKAPDWINEGIASLYEAFALPKPG